MYDLIKMYSKDKELVLELMKYDQRPAYMHADNRFKLDREFTLNAVKRSVSLLEIIPNKFKTDREISLIADKSGWGIIEYFCIFFTISWFLFQFYRVGLLVVRFFKFVISK